MILAGLFVVLFLGLATWLMKKYIDDIKYREIVRKIETHIEKNEINQAKQLIDRSIKKSKSKTPLMKWLKAQLDLKQRHYILAIAGMNEIMEEGLFSKDVPEEAVHLALAKTYDLSGRSLEAKAEYYTILNKNSDSLVANLSLARYLYEEGDYEKAFEFLNSVLKKQPGNLQAILLMAKIYYHWKMYDKMDRYLKEVLTIDAREEEALYLSGCMYMDQNNYLMAIHFFERCANLNKSYASASHIKKAMCLSKDKSISETQQEEARRMVDKYRNKIAKQDPLWKELHLWLLQSYQISRDYQKMEPIIESYLHQYPSDQIVIDMRDKFSPLFDKDVLMNFLKKDIYGAIDKTKQICKSLGFYVNDVNRENSSFIIQVTRTIKEGQRVVDSIFMHRGDMVGMNVIDKAKAWMRQTKSRYIFLFSPFGFKKDIDSHSNSHSIILYGAEEMNHFLHGMNIFISN